MKNSTKKLIFAVAVVVLIIVGFGVYDILAEDPITSIVILDVNPSVEIKFDRDSDVAEVNAWNEEAEKLLGEMRIKGMDVDEAANTIITSLLKHGYINEQANSILVSVEDKDSSRGDRLKKEFTEEINEVLKERSVNAAVFTQDIDTNAVKEIAEQYNISKGKAAFIKKVADANNTYEMKDLAKLSVNELNLILSNPKNEVKNVDSTGNADESAYIGKDAAKKAAFTHAKVEESNVRKVEVDFDYEYGKMIYEVEFTSGEYEYDYRIGADNGEVLYSHREYDAERED